MDKALGIKLVFRPHELVSILLFSVAKVTANIR